LTLEELLLTARSPKCWRDRRFVVPFSEWTSVLRVEDITVAISAVTILRGLSLAVETGTIVGLVGRNGAGKTTTLRSIMGLIHLSSGWIDLDGTKLDGMSSYARARLGIGYLPEDRRLVGALSVRDNLLIPAQASGVPDREGRLRRIFNLMPELREWSARRATTLSGGQQKMVALARAFVNGRKLLLLDEPFEGISTALSRRLAQTIQDFQQAEQRVTVLVAESDLKRAAMLTRRAFVIERGEVIEEAVLQT
jgi:branched-chain amino acid transport system ATP-binding protein